jgi:hypothetical protein
MVEREKEVKSEEYGSCPMCDSINYKRESLESVDDAVLADCYCLDCQKPFKERFVLKFQNWYEE